MPDDRDLILLNEADERAIRVFEAYIAGTKRGALAEEYGVSYNTIKNWINRAQEILHGELEKRAKNYYAEIFKRYSWIIEQAQEQYIQTRDVRFLAEMRAAMAELRKMMALDRPENKKPNVQIGNLIFQMDTGNYDKLEKETKKLLDDGNTIDGESREI